MEGDGLSLSMKIELHIERLVLDGLPIEHSDRLLVMAAVERELAQLLTAGGLTGGLLTGGAMPRLSAGEIRLGAESTAAQVGQQIAQAVYRGISK